MADLVRRAPHLFAQMHDLYVTQEIRPQNGDIIRVEQIDKNTCSVFFLYNNPHKEY